MIYCNWSKYRDLSGFDIFWFLDRTSRMQGALDRTIDMSDIRRLYAVNAFAQTPLHCAASSGSSAVVQDGHWRCHGPEWIENIRWSCCEIGVVPELDTRVSLFWGTLSNKYPLFLIRVRIAKRWRCPKFSRWLGGGKEQICTTSGIPWNVLKLISYPRTVDKLPWFSCNCRRCLRFSHRNSCASRDVQQIFLKMSWIVTFFPRSSWSFWPQQLLSAPMTLKTTRLGRTQAASATNVGSGTCSIYFP